MLQYLLPAAAMTMGQLITGWAGGKSKERASKQQAYQQTVARKETGMQNARTQASQFLNNQYNQRQALTGQKRRRAALINGMTNAAMLRPPAWYLPPSMRDVNKTAEQFSPESFTPTEDPGGGSAGWGEYLGLGVGAAAQIGGQAYGTYKNDQRVSSYLDRIYPKSTGIGARSTPWKGTTASPYTGMA